MTFEEEVRELHKRGPGKIGTTLKVSLETKEDLALAYTPGVAHISRLLAEDKSLTKEYTNVGNTVAIVTDGSAVLGLGNIGPEGAMPVMEGKAALFKRFAGIDAVPICLNTQDPEEIIQVVSALAPTFAGINLEDIAAPHCFDIEARLQEKLNIPVFHDDQHGTAIVVLSGLINALKLRNLTKEETRIVINGAGAAGLAIYELLDVAGYKSMTVVDSKGVLSTDRNDLHSYKMEVAKKTNPKTHTLSEALTNAHVFIGVSAGNVLNEEMIKQMEKDPIIFAMANPTPEVFPDVAIGAGAFIVATGRSDFPNQINNALAFPGLFRGALDSNTVRITTAHMIAAAEAIANLVSEPKRDEIVPSIFDPRLVLAISAVF